MSIGLVFIDCRGESRTIQQLIVLNARQFGLSNNDVMKWAKKKKRFALQAKVNNQSQLSKSLRGIGYTVPAFFYGRQHYATQRDIH